MRSIKTLCALAFAVAPLAQAAAAGGTLSVIPAAPVPQPAASRQVIPRHKLPADLKRQLDLIPLLDRSKNTVTIPAAPSAFAAPAPGENSPSTASVVSSWAGASDPNWTPSDTNAAYGPSYVIQAVNSRVVAYNRTGGVQGLNESLCTFLNVATGDCFDPRVKWDPDSQHFLASGIAVFGATKTSIVYMYSTSLTPAHANWCRYLINYNSFADYDTIGGPAGVVGISFDEFQSTSGTAPWLGSHFLRFVKPAKGATTCQTVAQLGFTENTNLKDANGHQVFAPFVADTTDPGQKGYIVARSGSVPSSNMWLFSYSPTTMPGAGKAIPLGITDDVPPLATQVGVSQLMDTGEGFLWNLQAAIDPARSKLLLNFAVTVPAAHGFQADTVMFRVDPATAQWVDRQRLHTDGLSTYGAAMASNRACLNGTCSGGSGWVISAVQSGSPAGLNPRAVVFGSSAPTTARVVHAAGGGYFDFECPNANDVCRMDYNGAEPDPRSANVGVSVTYAGGGSTTSKSTWHTTDGYILP